MVLESIQMPKSSMTSWSTISRITRRYLTKGSFRWSDLWGALPSQICPQSAVQLMSTLNAVYRVSIVKNGSMYPTMELLLRHSIGYLHLRGKSAVAEPGNLDNEDLLIQNMKKGILPDEERRVALSIYLLSCIMDGDTGATQMELWEQLVSTLPLVQIHCYSFAFCCTEKCVATQCQAADDIAVFDIGRVRWLATRFRAFEFLTGEDVHNVFDPKGERVDVPAAARRDYYWCVPNKRNEQLITVVS